MMGPGKSEAAIAATCPALVISLDFELAWGMETAQALHGYRANIEGARIAIPKMLDLFGRYNAHVTWATVGLLFFDRRDTLLDYLPSLRPQYRQPGLSAYERIPDLGRNEAEDPLHFGLSLIRQISDRPGQEVACHTFSHYYCLEDGQDAECFRADLLAAQAAASRIGARLKSLVFPRNQVQGSYLHLCREAGFEAFRGNPDSWLHRGRSRSYENRWRRAIRLADSYVPVSGEHSFGTPEPKAGLVNVPASIFVRPVRDREGRLLDIRLARIKRSMTRAAKARRNIHLWWHPENFGRNTDHNLDMLRQLLDHYQILAGDYGLRSLTMGELAIEAATAAPAAGHA